jgi:hypothetical protein
MRLLVTAGKLKKRFTDIASCNYSFAAASFGLQAGVEWFSYGWALGTDPNVAIIGRGAGATLSFLTTEANDVVRSLRSSCNGMLHHATPLTLAR